MVSAAQQRPRSGRQRQSAEARRIGAHEAADDQLAQQRPPLPVVRVGADAEGGEIVVAVLKNFRGRLAAQHVDDVRGAEALTGAHDAGHQLLRRHRAVEGARRRQANVAVAALRRRLFAEVAKQRGAATGRDFAPAEQRVQLAAFDAFVLFVRFGLLHHLPQPHHVLQAIDHPRFRGFAVAPGAARFLIIGFHALGQVDVRHEAHVRFVDAHAEGDGGDDHHVVLA